jgi:hypothetical protein
MFSQQAAKFQKTNRIGPSQPHAQFQDRNTFARHPLSDGTSVGHGDNQGRESIWIHARDELVKHLLGPACVELRDQMHDLDGLQC